jgi:hypothetical protein
MAENRQVLGLITNGNKCRKSYLLWSRLIFKNFYQKHFYNIEKIFSITDFIKG